MTKPASTPKPPFDAEISEKEGWFISYAAGNGDGTTWRLERRDEDPVHDSDQQAHAHVVARAKAGSQHHRDVLNFLREHEPKEYHILTSSPP